MITDLHIRYDNYDEGSGDHDKQSVASNSALRFTKDCFSLRRSVLDIGEGTGTDCFSRRISGRRG